MNNSAHNLGKIKSHDGDFGWHWYNNIKIAGLGYTVVAVNTVNTVYKHYWHCKHFIDTGDIVDIIDIVSIADNVGIIDILCIVDSIDIVAIVDNIGNVDTIGNADIVGDVDIVNNIHIVGNAGIVQCPSVPQFLYQHLTAISNIVRLCLQQFQKTLLS